MVPNEASDWIAIGFEGSFVPQFDQTVISSTCKDKGILSADHSVDIKGVLVANV